jgi:ABC-type uncharacterized transport system permease subunit
LPGGAEGLLFAELNEYRSLGIAIYRDGTLSVYDARTGQGIREEKFLEGKEVSSYSRNVGSASLGFGLSDGSFVLGQLEFTARFLEDEEQKGIPPLEVEGTAPLGDGIVEKTPIGQFRKSEVRLELNDPVPIGEGVSPVILTSYRAAGEDEMAAGFSADGRLTFSQLKKKQNMLTGKTSVSLKKYGVPCELFASPPSFLLLNARGDQIFLAWTDGQVQRFDLRDPEHPILAEKFDVTTRQARVTAFQFLLGDQSVLVGDSEGGCAAWFRVPGEAPAAGTDGYHMVAAHVLASQDGPITAFGISRRDKTFATGTAALEILDRHLDGRSYAVGADCSIADLSLFAYTQVAGEGGFDLGACPSVGRWFERIRELPGFVDDHLRYPSNALPGAGRSIYD